MTVEKLSDYEAVMKRLKNKEITAVVAMRLTGLKRTKFYELAKECIEGTDQKLSLIFTYIVHKLIIEHNEKMLYNMYRN